MKKFFVITGIAAIIFGCGNNETDKKAETASTESATEEKKENAAAPTGDANKGIGKFTKVEISPTLDAKMAESGQKVYDVKCAACHKLTEERLVGPGWKGVTSRRAPEWVMNFATNVDEMLAKDAEAQAQLEICLVRMPNQNLTDDDARHVFEFMRKNDGIK
ncbi:MAG: c-type cytochrome [Chitinophagaceae bacterium]